MDPVTENPAVGATEIWEFYNTTADAHPMHVHEVVF
jgi:FtsP/CotA-like multicopper oxidase with cupredoxin domain